MTTNQVLLGVALILVLAVGSQLLASRLKIPALIILLPAGFIVGAITTDVNPQELLGAAFQPLVSLAVAVILYDSGMSLNLRKLRGHVRRIVVRLIVMGVPVTLAFAAVFSGLLLNMSLRAAVMLGAILVVSGPTVVGPLLSFIRPTERLQHVLSWEGSLIDPVGGILGAVVFHAVIATTRRGPAYQLGQFLLGIGVGLAGGVVGTALLWFLLRKLRLGEVLGTTAQLARERISRPAWNLPPVNCWLRPPAGARNSRASPRSCCSRPRTTSTPSDRLCWKAPWKGRSTGSGPGSPVTAWSLPTPVARSCSTRS